MNKRLLFVVWSAACQVCASALAAPVPSPVAKQLYNHWLPDGSHQVVTQQFVSLPAQEIHARFKRNLKGMPYVQSTSAPWLITAVLHQGSVKITQVRQLAGRSQVLQSTLTVPVSVNQSRARPEGTPSWWPDLKHPWQRVAMDGHTRTTTLLGWLEGSLDHAVQVIVSAARRGGFAVSTQGSVRAKSGEYAEGVLLLLQAPHAELLVTISMAHARAGIVAHLKQVRR